MDETKWTIRKMRQADIEKCLHIWRQVELVEAYSTVASSLAVDPDGFSVVALESTGEVIGMCSATRASQTTAFIGFYGIDPKYQKIGIGRELWQSTLARFDSAVDNIGLYAVPEMFEKYARGGFVVEDGVKMLIYEGHKEQLSVDSLPELSQFPGHSIELVDAKASDKLFDSIVEFDQSVLNVCRRDLLSAYLRDSHKQMPSKAPVTVVVVEQTQNESSCCENNKRVVGYGSIRPDNTDGLMVGPVYASSVQLAELIVRSLLENSELKDGKILSAMPLSSNCLAAEILEQIGLKKIEHCTRLFTKFVPKIESTKVFYVHSPNFSFC